MSGGGLYLALDSIRDPGNLGTIIRSAEGAGATGIIMSANTVDIYNPKVIRSTMGALFRMPFIYVPNIVDTCKCLKDKGITLFAAHLNGSNYYKENLNLPMGIMIGNEGNGLTEKTISSCKSKITIPMKGRAESLNASAAACMIMWEMVR